MSRATRRARFLAGGDWNVISDIIDEELIKAGILVTVYDLPPRN